MVRWDYQLQLADVFHNDELTFEQKRDAIVRRIKATEFYEPVGYLSDIVEHLEDAQDVDEFDEFWSEFYDYADSWRIWVATV